MVGTPSRSTRWVPVLAFWGPQTRLRCRWPTRPRPLPRAAARPGYVLVGGGGAVVRRLWAGVADRSGRRHPLRRPPAPAGAAGRHDRCPPAPARHLGRPRPSLATLLPAPAARPDRHVRRRHPHLLAPRSHLWLLVRLLSPRTCRRRRQRGAKWASLWQLRRLLVLGPRRGRIILGRLYLAVEPCH
jgi:hypothetical protein